MATFQVGKTYYFNYWRIEKYEVIKKTKCYVWLKHHIAGAIYKKKINYTTLGNNEEYVVLTKERYDTQRSVLYAYCKWDKYWKIGKHDEGYEIVIRPDETFFYKMNTATLKMFKYICNEWSVKENNFIPLERVNDCLDFEETIKRHVEENTEDFDKDYYSLYYTANINWHMINTKYKQIYILNYKK
jgi:hypothetical protein